MKVPVASCVIGEGYLGYLRFEEHDGASGENHRDAKANASSPF